MGSQITDAVLADRMIGLISLEPEEIQKQITKLPASVKSFVADEEYLKQSQRKEAIYSETSRYRELLLNWIKDHPNDELLANRMKLLDNVNKRISIYDSPHYSWLEDSPEIENVFVEFDRIANKFLGLNEGMFTYEEVHGCMKEKLNRMGYEKQAMHGLVLETRDAWKEELKSKQLVNLDLIAALEKEVKLLDQIIAFYESKDYSSDDEEQWKQLYDLLGQTAEFGTEGPNIQELFYKNLMESNKSGISKEFNYYGVLSVKRGLENFLKQNKDTTFNSNDLVMRELDNINKLISIYESKNYSLDDSAIVRKLSKLIHERDLICIEKQTLQSNVNNSSSNGTPDISNIMEILLKAQENSLP